MTTLAMLTPPRIRQVGQRQDAEILSRLSKANGQLAGITSMYEDGRYCIDILDQLAAASAAIDAVGPILLQAHSNACVREAINRDDTDEQVTELVTAVRRFCAAVEAIVIPDPDVPSHATYQLEVSGPCLRYAHTA